ncbi:hypothetical protein, partial [Prevotella bivia]|uniref:hypothetical protein n=1 Tax=Prevotella bivia TaxID=28125 RepID=UPI001E425282
MAKLIVLFLTYKLVLIYFQFILENYQLETSAKPSFIEKKLTYSSFCRMESSLTTDIHWCSQQFKRFR